MQGRRDRQVGTAAELTCAYDNATALECNYANYDDHGLYVSSGGMSPFDIFVDLCFYADIVVNFWTGVDRGYESAPPPPLARRRPGGASGPLGFSFVVSLSFSLVC